MPTILIAICMCILYLEETEWSLEKLLHVFNASFVDQEKHNMVTGLYNNVVVSYNDLIPPYYSADVGPRRQVDILDFRPISFELDSSPWAMASMASAAPRLSEWTLAMSPRLM